MSRVGERVATAKGPMSVLNDGWFQGDNGDSSWIYAGIRICGLLSWLGSGQIIR
jgi:hypothetical protein